VDGELIAGCRLTQWNIVRLRRVAKHYCLSRNDDDVLGRFDKLERAIDAFERVTHGLT
jgi:hypothetical protein